MLGIEILVATIGNGTDRAAESPALRERTSAPVQPSSDLAPIWPREIQKQPNRATDTQGYLSRSRALFVNGQQ
jgi:hypothetical protein